MRRLGQGAGVALGFPSWHEEPLLLRVLLILSCFFSVALAMGAGGFVAFFALSEGALYKGEVWRLFTYALPHAGLWHLLFNFLVLWMFSPELSQVLGKLRFAVLLIFGIAAGGLAHVLASPSFVIGISAAVFAVLLYSALLWPRRRILVFFIFPMPLALFVLILAGIEFLLSLQGGGTTSHWAHLGGLIAGGMLYLYCRFIRDDAQSRMVSSAGPRPAQPRMVSSAGPRPASFEGKLSELGSRLPPLQSMLNTKVEIRSKPKTLRERIGFFLWKRRLAKRNAEQARVDALLDKVSREGIESLSEGERRFLDHAGKNR
jgi:membrane associated rhomboid family serine protease